MERYIPFNLNDVYWDYIIAPPDWKRAKEVRVLYAACLKQVIDRYLEVLRLVEADPVVLSLEASSLARALIARPTNGLAMRQDILQSDNSGAVMIADIGAQTTTVSVFSPEAILLISVMIPIAGQYFTDKIADVLKISMAEADHQKKQIGLVDQSNQKTEVPQILKTEIDLLRRN